MEKAIASDYKKMMELTWGGFALAILGCAAFIGGFQFWDWGLVPSAIIGLLVWGIGMALLTKVERFKKEHDLVTYREILAFSKGQPVDRDNPRSRSARQHRFLKSAVLILAAAVIGAALGASFYMLFG